MSDRAKIIFIDDDERMVRSLARLFRGDFDVVATTDPQVVLDLVRRERVHVIVSDQRMPDMEGVDLLRQVRAISPATIRMLLTGYADLAAVMGSINDGEIFRFVRKPWDSEELRRKVTDAVTIARELFELQSGLAQIPMAESSAAGTDVLVIDDSEEMYHLVVSVLGDSRTVHWSNTLDSVLDVMQDGRIGVVLSDVRLNGTDISGALKVLKRHEPTLLTVVLTSFQDSGQLIELINEAQVFRVLRKPVDPVLLQPAIAAAMTRARELDAQPRLSCQYSVEEMHGMETVPEPFLARVRSLGQRLHR
ncbi:response regulator [Tahibacter amnicola]|uniref:Response regulator n=1 Tax=Tahibacter amnicola TaxID=2976241 RepID=A0ABY6BB13_9GAMM|nr:response regulator [Tahibacter amnicola]UXI67249.1 response regulator [Tahibacter amnicola]